MSVVFPLMSKHGAGFLALLRGKEVALMKRIIVVLSLAALMLAMSALPALAVNSGTEGGGPPSTSGNPEGKTEVFHCNVNEGQKSAAVFNKNNIHGNCRLT
jgi:hypothetical protein